MRSAALLRRLDKLEHRAGPPELAIEVYYTSVGEPDLLVEIIRKQAGGGWMQEPHAGWIGDGPCSARLCERCRLAGAGSSDTCAPQF